jgi:hypothetical protein
MVAVISAQTNPCLWDWKIGRNILSIKRISKFENKQRKTIDVNWVSWTSQEKPLKLLLCGQPKVFKRGQVKNLSKAN